MLNLLKQQRIQIFIIVILTVVAYSNIFGNQLLGDDPALIRDWQETHDFKNIPLLLRGQLPGGHEGTYRPVVSVLYSFYYHIFGTNPFGYHLHGLLVHLGSTILIYFISSVILASVARPESKSIDSGVTSLKARFPRMTSKSSLFPFIVALLFGLHPIQTEAITYISASMDSLGRMAFFASLFTYLKAKESHLYHGRNINGNRWFFLGSILLAGLAFFSYEGTIILPLIIVLYEMCFSKTSLRAKRSNLVWDQIQSTCLPARQGLPQPLRGFAMTGFVVAPYFALAGFYLLIRALLIGPHIQRGTYVAGSLIQSLVLLPSILIKYLLLLIYPLDLSFVHTIEKGIETYVIPYSNTEALLRKSIFDPDILLSLSIILAIIGVGIYVRNKAPLVTFGIGWFFICLLPVSNIFPIGSAFSERYLYLASFGFILCLAYVSFWLARLAAKRIQNRFWSPRSTRPQNDSLNLLLPVVLCLVIFYSFLTFQRNKDWHTPEALWGSVIRVYPESLIGHYNLALYKTMSNPSEAIKEYQTILKIRPDFWEARYNLSRIYLGTSQAQLAIPELENVIESSPGYLEPYLDLAVIAESKDENERAIKYLNAALNQDTRNSKFLGSLRSPLEINQSYARIYDQLALILGKNPKLSENLNGQQKLYFKAKKVMFFYPADVVLTQEGEKFIFKKDKFEAGITIDYSQKQVSISISDINSPLKTSVDAILASIRIL